MGKARPAAARGKGPGAPAGAQGGRARPIPNPFEVKVNRQKFPVLGRKARHAVGQPGVSRARAVQKVRGGGRAAGTCRRGGEGVSGERQSPGVSSSVRWLGWCVPRPGVPPIFLRALQGAGPGKLALGGHAARVCPVPRFRGAPVHASSSLSSRGLGASGPGAAHPFLRRAGMSRMLGEQVRLSFQAQHRVPRAETEALPSVLTVPEYSAPFSLLQVAFHVRPLRRVLGFNNIQ